jgi:hypothetical protein
VDDWITPLAMLLAPALAMLVKHILNRRRPSPPTEVADA